MLEIVVRRDGSVGDVRLKRSLDRGLDQRAIEAVRQWRFAPARRHGVPVDVDRRSRRRVQVEVVPCTSCSGLPRCRCCLPRRRWVSSRGGSARGARVRESARVELLKALAFPDASAVSASGPSTSNWTPGSCLRSRRRRGDRTPCEHVDEPAPPIFGERGNPLTTLAAVVDRALRGRRGHGAGGHALCQAPAPEARDSATAQHATAVPRPESRSN